MNAPTLRFPPGPPSPLPSYAAAAAAPRHRGPVATALADVAGVFRLAGRVLRQHWPTLLALALIGVVLRAGAIIGAAYVEFGHGNLSWFVFALAPLAYLVPVIL